MYKKLEEREIRKGTENRFIRQYRGRNFSNRRKMYYFKTAAISAMAEVEVSKRNELKKLRFYLQVSGCKEVDETNGQESKFAQGLGSVEEASRICMMLVLVEKLRVSRLIAKGSKTLESQSPAKKKVGNIH